MSTRPDDKYIPSWNLLREAWMNWNPVSRGGVYASFVEKNELEAGFEQFLDDNRIILVDAATFDEIMKESE